MREELARAWIEHKVDDGGAVDYTAMAREEWMLNRDQYLTAETIDVAHILISTEDRTNEEALSIASALHEQLLTSPEQFAELARTRSDDPGSASRGGTYPDVKRGDMVKPFEDVAFALEIGEISEPVLTDFGYHLIRLDGKQSPEQQPFDAVRVQLENQARERYRERKRREYLQPLYAEEIEVTRDSVENAVERALGPDVLARNAQDEADP
jgi:parvulin-like peptidyl-prolyl isomerase